MYFFLYIFIFVCTSICFSHHPYYDGETLCYCCWLLHGFSLFYVFFTWKFQVVYFILFFVAFDLYFCWFLMKTQEFSIFDVIFESGVCCLPRINFRTDEIGLKVVFVVFFVEFLSLKILIFSRRNSTGESRRKFPKNSERSTFYWINYKIFISLRKAKMSKTIYFCFISINFSAYA